MPSYRVLQRYSSNASRNRNAEGTLRRAVVTVTADPTAHHSPSYTSDSVGGPRHLCSSEINSISSMGLSTISRMPFGVNQHPTIATSNTAITTTSLLPKDITRVTRQQRRSFKFWSFLRGGSEESSSSSGFFFDEDDNISDSPSLGIVDLSMDRKPIEPLLNGQFPVSVCSIRGFRSYMEDDFIVATDFCAVFDGHGGEAVSRFLRQNLYGFLQAELPKVIAASADVEQESRLTHQDNDETGNHVQDNSKTPDWSKSQQTSASSDPDALAGMIPRQPSVDGASSATTDDNGNPAASTKSAKAPTVDDYVKASVLAFDNADRNVQQISHWSFQGSTAVAVWIHEGEPTELSSPASQPTGDGRKDSTVAQSNHLIDAGGSSSNGEQRINPTMSSTNVPRHLITTNIGDSRAVLSRNGTAIDLSRDHKPNDPIERSRIEAAGGSVIWHGHSDREGTPIPGTGLYRVNGNLALSRAIGDRSERPAVTADPEISVEALIDEDEFVIIASDGLWDVMSSQDAVHLVRQIVSSLVSAEDREIVAKMLVEEALRRGSYDNITVVIVWLTKYIAGCE